MSIYWVKDTVNADVVGTVDTFSSPYGIQKAFDSVAAGDEIRIVTGSNNYNSSSTSWNNRDAADKTINIDTTAGTVAAPIVVRGYSDETTEAEITLDFDSASITGSHGLLFTTVGFYLVKNIHVTDCDTDGFHFSSASQLHLFIKCRATLCSSDGWSCDGAYILMMVGCAGSANTGFGFNGGAAQTISCEFYDNSSDGMSVVGGLYKFFVDTVFDGNTGDGFARIAYDSGALVGCLFEDNGGDGLNSPGGVEGGAIISTGFTNNTGNGLGVAAGDQVWAMLNCGFSGNGTDIETTASVTIRDQEVTTDPTFTDADNRDYSLGTNWKAKGFPYNGANNQMPSGDFSSFVDIGAAQREEPAGGGGGGGVRNPVRGPVG